MKFIFLSLKHYFVLFLIKVHETGNLSHMKVKTDGFLCVLISLYLHEKGFCCFVLRTDDVPQVFDVGCCCYCC